METILFHLGGFFVNFTIIFIITRFIYCSQSHDKNNIFTFIAFSTVIFFVIGLVTSVKISVGIGFGLFAMFSVLRYRTDTIPIRDMTYLFIIMTVSVMNAVMFNNGLFIQLAVANICVMSVTFVLEQGWGFNYELKKNVKYEKIELIRPENRQLFIEDLRQRTGISNIIRYEIGDIDFLKDSADVVIYYKTDKSYQFQSPYEPDAMVIKELLPEKSM